MKHLHISYLKLADNNIYNYRSVETPTLLNYEGDNNEQIVATEADCGIIMMACFALMNFWEITIKLKHFGFHYMKIVFITMQIT